MYHVATNKHLATLAQERPTTLAFFEGLEGFGAGRTKKYGAALLAGVTGPDEAAAEAATR